MKHGFLPLIGIITLVSLLFVGCAKDPSPIILPSEVDFGNSEIYLNGELSVGYNPVFVYDKVNKLITYGFVERKDDIVNSLGFAWLPQSTGDFALHSQRSVFTNSALTAFNQTINVDQQGYEYKLIDSDEGFFKVEFIDTLQQTVKGRFQAKFKRTSKNGNEDLDLPKVLLYQGVFNETYEKI